ncbi:MAG: glycine cleavage system protein H [Deltaproteobacteria bacterium]|nr:glycine cleavage system protein H [Deltaproteobacteria bacterium]MBW2307263.1 glycine cleavage system protein H [Deltaproteobacteria bacterium]
MAQSLLEFTMQTKGIEYLVAIGFMILFIFFWQFLNAKEAPERVPARAGVAETAKAIKEMVGGFLVPDGLHFHPGHAWVKAENSNMAYVGMSDFAQKLVGKIDEVHLPEVGSEIRLGETLLSMKIDSKSIDMLSPVDGKVVSINQEVKRSPEIINSDPYGRGWLIEVQAPKMSAKLKSLLKGGLAVKWMEEVGNKLFLQMNRDLGVVYQDGGLPVEGMARTLDKNRWDEIVKEFFLFSDQ